jgi:hypothetical protein
VKEKNNAAEYSLRNAVVIEILRHRPHRELPITASCMASFDLDAEVVSPEPATYTLPLPTLVRIGVPVLQPRADDHSSWEIVTDRIWLLCLQRASVWQLAGLARGLELCSSNSKVGCS